MASPAAAASLSAVGDGVRLLSGVHRGRGVGDQAPSSGEDAARADRPRAEPDGYPHQHAKREDDRKRAPWGYDAGQKVKGRKRHIAVDTDGLLLGIVVHAADLQDADGAWDLLKKIKPLYCGLRGGVADSIYERTAALLACFRRRLDPDPRAPYRRHHRLHGPPAPVGGRTNPRLARAAGGGCPTTTKSCRRSPRPWSAWPWSASCCTASLT